MRSFTYAKGILWVPRANFDSNEPPLSPDIDILLVDRDPNDDHRPGEADLPGGRVREEQGEDCYQGFLRELDEETGLGESVFAEQPVIKYADTIDDVRGSEKVSVSHVVFVARLASHDVVSLQRRTRLAPVLMACSELRPPSYRHALGRCVSRGLFIP